LTGALAALGGMIGTAQFHAPAPDTWVTALDLAEALVERGVPFRSAHHVVGGLVSSLVGEDRRFEDLSVDELVAFDDRFAPEDLDRMSPASSVASRVTPGGGSMASVAEQIAALRSRS